MDRSGEEKSSDDPSSRKRYFHDKREDDPFAFQNEIERGIGILRRKVKIKKTGETRMKGLAVTVCFIVLFLMGGSAFAADKENLLPVFKKMVADDKARFGVDVKKCRLECERVYSKEHCIAKCAEISAKLKAEGFSREAVEKTQIEEQKPVKYKEVAEKYR